ncbi:MFS transporter [Pseudonocardiaceae bacterium YIM PH 21723]|nr:MFS transporter [Pseudonocardiaceae bacterium YIM PH 21723]
MSANGFQVLDQASLKPFQRKVTRLSAAGMFLDGYDLTVIAVALPILIKQWHLSSGMAAIVAASAVLGMFIGALVLGRLTDKLGRKKMYLVDLICFVVFAILTALSQDVWQLIAFRFLLGLAIGADYSISPTLLAEYVSAKDRGKVMSLLGATWFLGAASTYVFALILLPLGNNSWRYMLLLGAVFALIVIYMRRSIPESPRWLMDHGRHEEAAKVLRQISGRDDVTLPPAVQSETREKPWSSLFAPRMIKITVFVCGFWFMYTLAYYGISLYTPTVLKQVTSSTAQSYVGSLIIGLVGLLGAGIGIYLSDRIGRRKLVIIGFAGLVGSLLVLALAGKPSLGLLIGFLALGVLFANMGPGVVNLIYPSELYPTSIRATGAGLAASFSRIGGIIGTLAFPPLVASWGIGKALWLFIGAGLIGLVISVLLAPETRGRQLEELNETLAGEPSAVKV